MLKRTHMCGQLRETDTGSNATLCGWVNTYRDQGKGLVFIDLRDRSGLTQIVFDQEDVPDDVMELSRGLRREDVIAVSGTIRVRDGGPNPKLDTGSIELVGLVLECLNSTENPPILPDDILMTSRQNRRGDPSSTSIHRSSSPTYAVDPGAPQ